MKIILTFVLSAFAALMLITARAAVLPACPPQMMDEVMAMLADKTDDEKLAVLVSTLDEFLKGGGGYSRVFIDDATNAVVEEINGELLGETPDIFTPEYLEMLRATMLEDMVTDYIGKFNILDLAAKTGRNVEIRMNFGDRGTLTVATFSPEQVAEALHNYQPAQPPIEGDVVEGIDPLDYGLDDLYEILDTVPTVETLVVLTRLIDMSIAESGNTTDHAWIEEVSKKVVFSQVSNDYARANLIDEAEIEAAKHLFLDTYKQYDSDDNYIMHYILLTAAHVGYDVELRMCDEEHIDTPFVLVFTPDEIFDAFSE